MIRSKANWFFIFFIVSMTPVSLAQETKTTTYNPGELLVSSIKTYDTEPVKSASFDEAKCVLQIVFKNRTIEVEFSKVSSEGIGWESQGNDLTLILTSIRKQKAFLEMRDKSEDVDFPTLHIHFRASKIKDEGNFRKDIMDAIKRLSEKCK